MLIQKEMGIIPRTTFLPARFPGWYSSPVSNTMRSLRPFATHSQTPRLLALRRVEQVLKTSNRPLLPPAARRVPSATNQARSREKVITAHTRVQILIPQITRQVATPFASMPFETHRVGPVQVIRLFSQKVEKVFKAATRRVDGGLFQPLSSRLIDKGIDIVHTDFSPLFLTHNPELAQVTQNNPWRCADPEIDACKYCSRLLITFHYVHESVSLCRSIPAQTNSV